MGIMKISVGEIERKRIIKKKEENKAKKEKKLKKRKEIIEYLAGNDLFGAVIVAIDNDLLKIIPPKYLKRFVRSINGDDETVLEVGFLLCKMANISNKNLKNLKENISIEKQKESHSNYLDSLCRG